MFNVELDGTVFRNVETKTSKAGKEYVTVSLKPTDRDGAWSRVMAFNDGPIAELLRYRDGDAIAVKGSAKVEAYIDRDGKPRASITIFASTIHPLDCQPERQQEPDRLPSRQQEPSRQSARAAEPTRRYDPIDDEIPF